jgi:beta-lactam-binding protein with PASTA domain
MQRARRIGFGSGTAAVALAVLVGVVLLAASPALAADDLVRIPDVASKARGEAVSLLEAQGFLVATFEVAGTPPDTVESQVPPAGTEVPRGAPVTIFVRRTVAIATTAPNAVGLTPAEAGAALGSVYHLRLTPTTGGASDRGKIVSQAPGSGQPLEFRGVLELRFVPDPSLSPTVTAPDVVGLSGADAEKAVVAAGLTARRAQTALPGTPADITIAQMPGPGTEMKRYDVVDLIVTVEGGAAPAPGAPAETEVPNLTNLTEASARAELEKAGLAAEVEWIDGDPAMVFLVQDQDPSPGSRVPVGGSVRLRIVKYAPAAPPAPSMLLVPTLVGLTQGQADALLQSMGLVPNPVLLDNPSVVPFRVFSQLQLPGSSVAVGTTITFRVAKPTPPTLPVPVPNFYGTTHSQALAAAALAGLTLDAQLVHAPGHPVHRVFSQSIPANTVVPIGTTVQVRIAKFGGGPGTTTVPNLQGKTWGQANSLLGAAGLGSSGSYAVTGAHPPYRVFQQSVPPGATVPVGTVISFLVAKPPAALHIVPNLSGKTQAQALAAIAAAGLSPDIDLVPGAPHPLWRVYWQSPPAGANVPGGTVVHARIATPGGPGLKKVPNLIGLTAPQAAAKLAAAGLGSAGSTVFVLGKPPSRVYSQSHAAGAFVPAGTVVHWKKQPP